MFACMNLVVTLSIDGLDIFIFVDNFFKNTRKLKMYIQPHAKTSKFAIVNQNKRKFR